MPNKQYGKNYKASCKKYVRHNLNDIPYNLNYIRHCLKPIKPFGNEMLINCLYATITIFQSVIQFSTHHGKAFRKHRREKTRAYHGGTPYDVLKSFAVDFLQTDRHQTESVSKKLLPIVFARLPLWSEIILEIIVAFLGLFLF